MRSRFAAFAVGDAAYLWKSTHPDHEDRAHPREEMMRAWRATAHALKWMRLRILDAKDTRVLFLASVFDKGVDRSFIELSTFARGDEGWRYLLGDGCAASNVDDVDSLTIDSFASRGSVEIIR
jgi:SEC-C motif domain protein